MEILKIPEARHLDWGNLNPVVSSPRKKWYRMVSAWLDLCKTEAFDDFVCYLTREYFLSKVNVIETKVPEEVARVGRMQGR